MTALCDRPSLTADELRHMLSLAMPSLEWTGGFDYVTDNGIFIKCYPNALPQHRWQLTEILLDCANYRHTRKDGGQSLKTKRVSKRFATLIDAVNYYEMEIKK